MNGKLFALSQYPLPHHWISRAAHWLADCENPAVKNRIIRWFAKRYQIDMQDALEEDLSAYPSFNAFFTRALKPGARPLPDDAKAICCPADGAISQLGQIENGRIFQAKGHRYSLTQLLGGDPELADRFMDGTFATIYLSPRDYHRVHMPATGVLEQMLYVPGRLFSVNQSTAENIPGLFARNERVVTLFNTEQGPMAVILVGAMIVASIETVWAGQVTPLPLQVTRQRYQNALSLQQGEEMGRFKLGSTAIILFPKDSACWNPELTSGTAVRMGESLGCFTS